MKFRNTRTSTINAKVPTFDEICEKVGFGDLKVYSRVGDLPLMRGAVWNYMYRKGVTIAEIARQSNRSNATVWSGVKKFNAYLDYGDKVSIKLRAKVNEVLSENG